MRWRETSTAAVVLMSAAVVSVVAGCGPQLSPEEEVEAIRSRYTAELQSLTVKQDPTTESQDLSPESQDPPQSAEGALGEDEAGGEPAAAAELGEAEAEQTPAERPVETDVILDILVSTTSDEYLAGVTLDVFQVDAEEREKDRRHIWVDTSDLLRGGGTQVTHVLEDVDYEPGDGFYVEVRTPIPPDERAEYREFELD